MTEDNFRLEDVNHDSVLREYTDTPARKRRDRNKIEIIMDESLKLTDSPP